MSMVSVADIEEWREVSSEHFVHLECRSLDREFRGTLDTRLDANQLSVTRVRTGPIQVERTEHLARTDGRDDLLLTMQLRSSGAVSQYGRVARLQPRNAALYDVRQPYRLSMPNPGQDLAVLRVPRSQLGLSDAAIAAACARVFERESPGVAALGGFVSGLTEDGSVPFGIESDLASVTAQLVGSVIRGWLGQTHHREPGHNRQLLDEMRAHIASRAWDPSFDVTTLALETHLSVRKTHALFAAVGQTPGECIRTVRLRAAAELLRKPEMADASVQTIAQQCGYLDISTFTRAFKKLYGTPPGAWRRHVAA